MSQCDRRKETCQCDLQESQSALQLLGLAAILGLKIRLQLKGDIHVLIRSVSGMISSLSPLQPRPVIS